jgi:hypothetical protein
MPRTAAIHFWTKSAILKAARKAADADRRTVASLVEKVLVEYLVRSGFLKPAAF